MYQRQGTSMVLDYALGNTIPNEAQCEGLVSGRRYTVRKGTRFVSLFKIGRARVESKRSSPIQGNHRSETPSICCGGGVAARL